MSAAAETFEDGCDCRRVRYRLASRPRFVHCCHCRWCQRETGSAFALNAVFADFDDYWQPFLGGQGPAPAYAMSLTPEARAALRDRLHKALPTAADGRLTVGARAWAVRGSVPATA